jgi:hypothetical protein
LGDPILALPLVVAALEVTKSVAAYLLAKTHPNAPSAPPVKRPKLDVPPPPPFSVPLLDATSQGESFASSEMVSSDPSGVQGVESTTSQIASTIRFKRGRVESDMHALFIRMPETWQIYERLFLYEPQEPRLVRKWRALVGELELLFPDGGFKQSYSRQEAYTDRKVAMLFKIHEQMLMIFVEDVDHHRSFGKLLFNPLPKKLWKSLKEALNLQKGEKTSTYSKQRFNKRGSPSKPGRSQAQAKCFRCGMRGHLKASCRVGNSRARRFDKRKGGGKGKGYPPPIAK